jgi:beta-glucosidase
LGYARFDYDELTLDREEINPEESVTVSVQVTNRGSRPADEVGQLYLHQRYGSASRPVRELKGFQRLSLGGGESRMVSFDLGADQLRYWNAAQRDWVVDASTFDVWVGGDSTAALATTFTVSGGS